MLRVVVVVVMVGAITGMVGLLGFLPVAAQDDPSATRSFDKTTVEPGGEVVVTITATGYGSLGAVTETLPVGFNYVSSSLTDEGEVRSRLMLGLSGSPSWGRSKPFNYTVTASDVERSHTFSGMLRDSDRKAYDVVCPCEVTVEADAQPPEDDPSATRSFDKTTVEPGGEVVVTITATGYGSLGAVTETLPVGFNYVSSSLTDEGEVTEVDARTVRFTLLGAVKPFNYTVTASNVERSHTFSGMLRDSDRKAYDVVCPCEVTVEADAQPPEDDPSATRSFDKTTVEPGGEVVVTITATGYGSLGAVTETLPVGFNYVSSSLTDEGEVTEVDARTVRFTLLGAVEPFNYTVTASNVERSHTFSGMLRDSDRKAYDVVCPCEVTVEADAQPPEDDPSATRSFDKTTVEPGGKVVVTITATGYGSLGAVTETLPVGFNYVSSSLTDEGEVTEVDARTVRFALLGAVEPFNYTVTASNVERSHTFSGMLRDSDRKAYDVVCPCEVTVEADAQPPDTPTPAPTPTTAPAPDDPSATRSFDKTTVEPGGKVVVTITATGYGSLGAVTETLPAGFSYVEDSATVRAKVDGQDVTFTILGADQTFSYQVTASSVADSHTFQGTLKDDQGVSRSIGGASSVTVMAATVTPSDTEATRSFSASSVAPAGEITVTISAANYGDFGQVVETLPAGFSYVEDSATVRAKVDDGQDVTFTILGADQTFSYQVTASSVADSHTFQGTLKDDQGVSRSIGGASSVTVMAATVTPSDTGATRSFSASSVAPAGEITVTISAANYGDFGQVVETLPAGFSYVEDSATVRAKVDDGQDVTFTILGADQTFSYRVTASSVADSHTFQGTLKDDQGVSRSIGGASSVTVQLPPGPASRSFSASRVSPGGQLKVTITARGYGPFGQVVETLPRGFAYVDGSITPSDTRVAKDGQDVTVTLLGEDKRFTYTVTVSRVVGTHSFSGILTDSEQIQSGIGGAARIAVAAAPRPTPTSRPSSGTGSGSGGQPSSPTSTPTPRRRLRRRPRLRPLTPAPTPTTAPAPTATTAPTATPTTAPAPTAMTAPTATPTTAPAPAATTAPTATPTTAPAPAATTAPTATPTVGPGVTEEEGGGLPVWASIVIIIGVLGLVVVGGLFFLRSRRR